ncbi:MAG: DUF2336 domain-containing protein [Alphaproteobacteria bacterium]|nr:DUF2336 domain-containing protein [Alphaproteobacteria bacterium]
MAGILTETDVARLLADRSPETRVATAEKIAGEFTQGGLSQRERTLAVEIFRLMMQDAETRVRQTLAQELKACPYLPHDLAKAMASDVEQVAVPVLQYSVVLTDADLIEIVTTLNRAKQQAVARRARVSAAVSAALVDHGDSDVAIELLRNTGATIEEPALMQLVQKHGTDDRVMQPLVDRSELPVTVAERLVTRVSEEMRRVLVLRHNMSDDLATSLTTRSRERVTVGLLKPGISDAEVQRIVTQLRAEGRLTPSLLLRMLCEGDLRFFEAAMATLAGIPWLNAARLIHDAGQRGLAALCRAAGLPDQLYPAVYAALAVARETAHDARDEDRERHARRSIERMVTQVELLPEFGVENLDYLLAKMSALPPSPAA